MNGLQFTGLVLIVACVVSIFAGVVRGQVSLFIAALVLGIAGNILYWFGKPHYEEDDSETPGDQDQKPGGKPPAS